MSYWVSFRIHEDSDYSSTYNSLHDGLEALAGSSWWFETTSFYILEAKSYASVVKTVKESLRKDRDIAVVGSFNTKACTIIGRCEDQDIFDLVDFAKKD